MSPTVFPQRLIAFLDVLGFSQRLANTPLEDIHVEYSALIDEARTRVFDSKDTQGTPENNFAWARFVFDSLIVVSNDVTGPDGARSAFKFISAVVLLLELSFARRLPLRGCIGQADVLEDPDRGILLSPVFARLLATEKMFDWSGVVVLPDHADDLMRLLHLNPPAVVPQSASHFLVRYTAPEKGGASPNWLCLNWLYFLSDAELSAGFSFLDDAKGPPTRAFLDFIRSLPSQGAPLPEKFRPATHLRVVIASSGARMKFADDAGNGFDPPNGATIQIAIVPAIPTAEDAG